MSAAAQPLPATSGIARARRILWRTARSFYDDQMTQHAAALTYYALMSLFPAALLGISLLALIGQYPDTYDAILGYVRDVAPSSAIAPIDDSLRTAFRHKDTATTAVVLSVLVTFYGTTGVLEAARRALNVVFGSSNGRSFWRRKTIDVAFTFVLGSLVLSTLVMVFIGGRLADDLFGFMGLGSTAAKIWSIVRWPGALAVTALIFALVYYVTPDVKHRSFKWITPGAVVGVLLWLLASLGFSLYLSNFGSVNALYGAFTGAIVLVGWLWLTNVALLFGAELNAAIEREIEFREEASDQAG
jgi:membrane protein